MLSVRSLRRPVQVRAGRLKVQGVQRSRFKVLLLVPWNEGLEEQEVRSGLQSKEQRGIIDVWKVLVRSPVV